MRMMLAFAFAMTAAAPQAKDNTPPEGFEALFNGKDLTGWQGLVEIHKREKDPEKLAAQIKAASEKTLSHWKVEDGVIHFDGKAPSLQTTKDYGDVELWVDWKIKKNGDSGIYLRGQPQVQIWDPDNKPAGGVGSGGLYNNQKSPSKPLKRADKPIGEWNTFRIVMKGDVCNIWLNGELVVKDTPLENYHKWGEPLPATGPIELQNHGDELWFKNIYLKELK